MREETVYYVECTICNKEKAIKEKPMPSEEKSFICKSCIKTLPEPQRKDFDDLYSYVQKVENWEDLTSKRTSYDWDNLEKDLFEEYGVKGKKAELCYEKAREDGHSEGFGRIVKIFDDLVELIK